MGGSGSGLARYFPWNAPWLRANARSSKVTEIRGLSIPRGPRGISSRGAAGRPLRLQRRPRRRRAAPSGPLPEGAPRGGNRAACGRRVLRALSRAGRPRLFRGGAGGGGGGGDPAPAPRLVRLIARKASYYQERVRREGYPFSAGAAGLVRDVAARGWMLGVVTGAPREEVEGALRQEGLLDRFKVLITTEDVREGKPDPEGYERALEAFNSLPPLPERLLHPHEVLAVEDSPGGLAAAAEAGLPTLGLARAYSRDRLRGADAVVEDLRELTAERLERL